MQIILAVAINGERPDLPEDCSKPLADLITRCWKKDPRDRPSTHDLLRIFDLMINVSRAYQRVQCAVVVLISAT